MEWFEPLIAIFAISLVMLPIIKKVIDKKKGKSSCGCSDCDGCSKNKECLSNFKAYLKSEEFKKEKMDIKSRKVVKV